MKNKILIGLLAIFVSKSLISVEPTPTPESSASVTDTVLALFNNAIDVYKQAITIPNKFNEIKGGIDTLLPRIECMIPGKGSNCEQKFCPNRDKCAGASLAAVETAVRPILNTFLGTVDSEGNTKPGILILVIDSFARLPLFELLQKIKKTVTNVKVQTAVQKVEDFLYKKSADGKFLKDVDDHYKTKIGLWPREKELKEGIDADTLVGKMASFIKTGNDMLTFAKNLAFVLNSDVFTAAEKAKEPELPAVKIKEDAPEPSSAEMGW